MEPLVPLAQTIIWLGFFVVILFVVRLDEQNLFKLLFDRVKSGAPISTPWGSIGSPPAEIRAGEHIGVTAEGAKGADATEQIKQALQSGGMPSNIVESPYLVHAAQVLRPRTEAIVGLYRVRVWLEADPPNELDKVTRVTYWLHPTFPQRIIATVTRDKNFELWLNGYGEFTIIAVVERDGQSPLWLTRYLDLPGRPPD